MDAEEFLKEVKALEESAEDPETPTHPLNLLGIPTPGSPGYDEFQDAMVLRRALEGQENCEPPNPLQVTISQYRALISYGGALAQAMAALEDARQAYHNLGLVLLATKLDLVAELTLEEQSRVHKHLREVGSRIDTLAEDMVRGKGSGAQGLESMRPEPPRSRRKRPD